MQQSCGSYNTSNTKSLRIKNISDAAVDPRKASEEGSASCIYAKLIQILTEDQMA